jgi:hypothetical protein
MTSPSGYIWCPLCKAMRPGGLSGHPTDTEGRLINAAVLHEDIERSTDNPFKGMDLDPQEAYRASTRQKVRWVEGGPESDPKMTIGQLIDVMAWTLYSTGSAYKSKYPGATMDQIASGMNLDHFWELAQESRDSGFLDEQYSNEWIYQNIILQPNTWNRVIRDLEAYQSTNRNRVWDNSYMGPEPGSRSHPPSGSVEHRRKDGDRPSKRQRFFKRMYPSIRGEANTGADDPGKTSEFGF